MHARAVQQPPHRSDLLAVAPRHNASRVISNNLSTSGANMTAQSTRRELLAKLFNESAPISSCSSAVDAIILENFVIFDYFCVNLSKLVTVSDESLLFGNIAQVTNLKAVPWG
jgi:hypothetical protein